MGTHVLRGYHFTRCCRNTEYTTLLQTIKSIKAACYMFALGKFLCSLSDNM